MRIVKKNLKMGEIEVVVTNNEDLWYLSNILEEGDLVSGNTERKIKIGSDDNSKTVRKYVFLEIKTEKIEFVPENNALRILGVITKGPDDVPLGEHHSFNTEINDKLKIKKTSWPSYILEKLEESTKEKSNILMVAFDREEVKYALLKNSGYTIISEKKGDVQKKQDETQKTGNFYKDISLQIKEYVDRYKIQNVIIASPAFWKEYLLKELSEEIKKKTISSTISGVDESSFQELLKRPELHKLLENERTSKELQIIDEIMDAIRKEKACYGFDECKQKIEEGATLKLAVSENLIVDMREKGTYFRIDKLLKNAEKVRTKIMIISGKESAKKLDGLGGIAGILRW